MRTAWRRSLIIVIIIGAVLLWLTIKPMHGGSLNNGFEVRLATPTLGPELRYDPARIDDSIQSNIVRGIYSTLLYIDKGGNVQHGVASSHVINGRSIRFTIRSNLKTIDGYKVTAYDVITSFKRLLLLKTNTHGDLRSFICSNANLRSIDDECPELRALSDLELEIELADTRFVPFFLKLIVNADFSIIPTRSLDIKSPTLKIVDFRNTSGPFFFETVRDDGNHTLALNPNHFLAHSKAPQKIHLVPSWGEYSVQNFKDKKVDVIPSFDFVTYAKAKELGQKFGARVFETVPIKTVVIVFTEKGRKRLSINQRHALGQRLKEVYLAAYAADEGLEPIDHFFGDMDEAGLSPAQAAELEKRKSMAAREQLPSDVIGEVYIRKLVDIQAQYASLSGVTFQMPESQEHEPDFTINFVDAGFYESIALVAYLIDYVGYNFSREQTVDWLKKYMTIENKLERLKMIRDLHFKMLSQANMVPIGATVYTTIAQGQWRADINQLYAGTPLWMLTKE